MKSLNFGFQFFAMYGRCEKNNSSIEVLRLFILCDNNGETFFNWYKNSYEINGGNFFLFK